MVGISFQQVASYQKKHLFPAMQTAVRAVQAASGDVRSASGFGQAVDLTKTLTKSSPFLERLEKLWVRADRALDKAESDDEKFCHVPGLLNQAHKNVELLGRVTGELETAGANNIAIQVVIPVAAAPTVPAPESEEPQTIDISLVKR